MHFDISLPLTHPQHSPPYSTSSQFPRPQHSPSQPGLQRMVLRLEDLIRRIDSDLHHRFEEEGVQFMQFSFRWSVLLLSLIIRLCVDPFTFTLNPLSSFLSHSIPTNPYTATFNLNLLLVSFQLSACPFIHSILNRTLNKLVY